MEPLGCRLLNAGTVADIRLRGGDVASTTAMRHSQPRNDIEKATPYEAKDFCCLRCNHLRFIKFTCFCAKGAAWRPARTWFEAVGRGPRLSGQVPACVQIG